jgi:cyclopropane fatty-acyl-phospholipid synthase-like methyltransferase
MSYNVIYKHYENCFDKHGDSHLGVDWPNEDDVHKRFDVMLNIIKDNNKKVSILDFGCGCGHLLEYIQSNKNLNIEYSGLDISDKFYELCKKKFPDNNFYKIDILKEDIELLPKFDYIILNGVFTEKRNLSDEEMFSFFSKILKKIFNKTNVGIAFNVMCPIVDFKNDELFYLSYDKLGLFLKNNLSRNYIINNHYKLWEYTTFVYK